jgi:hypothetical protein
MEMSRQNDELERIKRIRERQLQDRDPRARDRVFHGQLSSRRRGKKLTLQNVIKDFQAKWTWMAGGAIIGIVLAVLLNLVLQATWAQYAGYFIVLFCIVLGRVFGAIRDWGDEDWGRKY